MTLYVLAQFRIHDRQRYETYVAEFPPVLARFGGRLLVADEAPQVVEGEYHADKVVLLAFPDAASFERFANSEDYQTISRNRVASTEGSVVVLRGVWSSAASLGH